MPVARPQSHPPHAHSMPIYAPHYTSSNASSSSHRSSPAPSQRSDLFDDLFQSPTPSSSADRALRPTFHSLGAYSSSSVKQQDRSQSASPRLPVASIISLYNSSASSPLRPPPSREPSPSPTTTLSSRPATPPSPGCCYEITLTDHWLGQQLRKPPPPVPSRASSRASSSCASGQLINLSVHAPSPPILRPTPTVPPRKRASIGPLLPPRRTTPSPVPPPNSRLTTPSPRPSLPPRPRLAPPPVPARRKSSELRIGALWQSQIRAAAQKDRLPGLVVRGIWSRSGLEPDALRKIWDEVVDGDKAITSLTYKQFAHGIDLINQSRH